MLTTEIMPNGSIRVTNKHEELVGEIARLANGKWWVVMNSKWDHGGISHNWFKTMKGAEHAVLAAYYDNGGE